MIQQEVNLVNVRISYLFIQHFIHFFPDNSISFNLQSMDEVKKRSFKVEIENEGFINMVSRSPSTQSC